MKHKIAIVLAAGLLLSCALPAKASFLSSLFTFGANNQIRDDSIETVFDVNGDHTLSVGDVIVGVTEFNSVNGHGTANHVYGIVSTQIASVVANGSNFDVYFTPTTAAGLTLSALTGQAMPATSFGAVYSGLNAELINSTLPPVNTFSNIKDYINYIVSNATNPNPEFVIGTGTQVGVSPTGPTAAQPYYWHALTVTSPGLPVGPGAALSLPGGLLAGSNVYLAEQGITPVNPTDNALNYYTSGDQLVTVDAGLVVNPNPANDAVRYGTVRLGPGGAPYSATITNGAAFGAGGANNPGSTGNSDPNYPRYNDDLTGAVGGLQDNGTLTVHPLDVVTPAPPGGVLLGIGGIFLAGAACLRRRKAQTIPG